ncbi:hypothetical protein Tco_0519938 [Tanacetum coccineum]
MLAKRVQEEQELSEQQLKRKAEGESISNDDFAKRMVEMINENKKFYAEQKAKAKRSKPMTQAQQREYMSTTFIKNQIENNTIGKRCLPVMPKDEASRWDNG